MGAIDTLSMLMLHLQTIVAYAPKNGMTRELLTGVVCSDIIGYSSPRPTAKDLKNAREYQLKIFRALLQVPSTFYEQYFQEDPMFETDVEVNPTKSSTILNKAKSMIFKH